MGVLSEVLKAVTLKGAVFYNAVAAQVGYDSESAFNRAFKRAFRVPPARFRRDSKPMVERAAALRDEAAPSTGVKESASPASSMQ